MPPSDGMDLASGCACQRWATLDSGENESDLKIFLEEYVPTVAESS